MTQTETRIFHYDLWGHLIAETNQSGQMLAEYIYLGDQLLSMIKPGEAAYYFHNDHLGTPQVLTNDSQAIAWKAVYTPFGEAVPSIQTIENPFRFPGQYYDQETGLHYNYFRYYNPQTGRYITPDPIGLEGGINLFAYVDSVGKPFETNLYTYTANNPINHIDPLGLWYIDINFSLGYWGGGTGGIMISPEGIFPYAGGGLVSPPGGVSVTWSPSDPTTGWNVGLQGGYWGGGQVGYSFGEGGGLFWEVGFVTPGGSLTGYYVWEPWKWPWKKDKEKKNCK